MRWETQDRPAFVAAFKKAGVSYVVNNANGDAQRQKTQADQCLGNGAKVVILTSLDAGSSLTIEQAAKDAGAKVVEYDRQVTGGKPSIYVSFDGASVGVLQGKAVVAGLKANGKYGKKPVVAELHGGQTDNNSTLFKTGYESVLNPLYKNGTFVKGPQQYVPDWDNQKAGTIFEQMLVKTSNKIDGVAAANDGLANAVVVALKAHKLKPIPLSGQDATPQGVQNIISGWQTVSVFKDTRLSATNAAQAAIALIGRQDAQDDRQVGRRPGVHLQARLDHEGELQDALHEWVPEEEGRLRGRLREVLQVGRIGVGAPRGAPTSPPASMNAAIATGTPRLEIRGISKSFGSVQALSDVDFEVRNGEVMALVGDNGAGKSTLIKCIAGIYTADSGEILFEGQPVTIHGPKDSARLGIEVVYQDLALCDNLDVVQNMFLGREVHNPFQLLKEPEMEARTRETMKGLSVTTIRSIRQLVATLSGGQRQSVAVARAVLWNSKLVILDEPTAALGVAQTQQVLDLVARLADQGLAVVLISHNLHDIFAVAHRITVLRLGRSIGVYERAKTTQQELVEAITAGVPDARVRHPGNGRGGRLVSVEHDPLVEAPPPLHDPTGIASYPARIMDNLRSGNLGSGPVIVALAADRGRLQPDRRQLLHRRQLQQHHPADGGHDAARLRRGVRPADR